MSSRLNASLMIAIYAYSGGLIVVSYESSGIRQTITWPLLGGLSAQLPRGHCLKSGEGSAILIGEFKVVAGDSVSAHLIEHSEEF